ncbi:hypothetical protein KP509_24G069800 [Ceratopteris richardii]|uniref:Uncharacterized protein n=1 Tax=Ceratopteris richardii TaxID=49495 RepID=A0A8T2RW33_CERRI|nr:hypothetical protein KP509_24G069800 [Ceratopteris richardii]
MAFLCLIITELFAQIAPSILGPSSSLPAASLFVPFAWRHMATLLLLLDFYQSTGSSRPTVTSTLAPSFCGHGPDLSASLIYDSLDSSNQSIGQCLQPLMQPLVHASGHAGPLCAPAAPTGAPATSNSDQSPTRFQPTLVQRLEEQPRSISCSRELFLADALGGSYKSIGRLHQSLPKVLAPIAPSNLARSGLSSTIFPTMSIACQQISSNPTSRLQHLLTPLQLPSTSTRSAVSVPSTNTTLQLRLVPFVMLWHPIPNPHLAGTTPNFIPVAIPTLQIGINDDQMIHLVVQFPSMQASVSHPQPLHSVCGHQQRPLLQFFVLHSSKHALQQRILMQSPGSYEYKCSLLVLHQLPSHLRLPVPHTKLKLSHCTAEPL